MTDPIRTAPRRTMPALAPAAVAAAVPAVGLSAPALASTEIATGQSQNWAGYVAATPAGGQQFTSVSGSWVQPSAASDADGYSAFWVGLGGANGGSPALEQVGADANRTSEGTEYSAWYEFVPTARGPRLAISSLRPCRCRG